MNLRWLFGNFTDPQYKLSRADQRKLTWEAHEKHLNQVELWTYTALFVALPGVAAIGWGIPLLTGALNVKGNSLAYLGIMAGFLFLFWIFAGWMYRFLYVKPIRRAMRDAGFVLCLDCGYELRGLPDDVQVCPECGAQRTDLEDGE